MPAGLLKVREVAEAAHLSERTVRRLVASGALESVRLGPRSTRVWAESLARLLSAGYDVAEIAGARGDER